jgi:hypothetical protein
LVTLTREDLPLGAVVAQTVHSSTTFAHQYPSHFSEWKLTSDYVACLATKDEQHLLKIYDKLLKAGANVVLFREPDLNNQATSLCFFGTPDLRRITSNLPLLFKKKLWIGMENPILQ